MMYLKWFGIITLVGVCLGTLVQGLFLASLFFGIAAVFSISQSYDLIAKFVPVLGNNGLRIAIITVACIVGAVFLPEPPKEKSTGVENRASQSMAQVIATNYVREQLVSPSSADFKYKFEIGNVEPDRFVVQSYVDAQNRFGVVLRNRFSVTMYFKGGDDADPKNWEFKDFIMVEQ